MLRKIVFLLIIILIISSCDKKSDTEASATWKVDKSEKVFPVETLIITKGVLYPTVKSSGLITGIREAYITSETKGIIKNVNFEIGDSITGTTILLKVDDSIAKISLEQAEEQLESANLELTSTENFYKKGNASLSELTRARSSANGAQVLYKSALKAVNDSSIKSPIIGEIATKESGITQGNYLNQGQKVAKVVDLSKIRVEISLGERQIGLIQKDSNAKIKLTALKDNHMLKGSVVAIAAGSELSTGSFKVIVEADNTLKDIIKSGMSCSVEIETKEVASDFLVPSDSIITRDGKKYIFIANNGIAEPREVSIKKVVGTKTAIGISLHDKEEFVIISGLTSIKPGIKVESTVIGNSGEWL